MDQSVALAALVQQFSKARVLCLGDVILDSFNHGSVDRISPERPVPVFRPGSLLNIPGGAANVARNVTALGAHCTLVGLVGRDEAGSTLCDLLDRQPNLKHRLIVSQGMPTTHKVRFTAAGQHIMRLDSEDISAIGDDTVAQLYSVIHEAIGSHDVLILSDYAKGLFSMHLLAAVIGLARERGVPVIVDPKGTDFARYRGATLLTPNASEATSATGVPIKDDAGAEESGRKLLGIGSFDAVLITRGPDGMSLIDAQEAAPLHFVSTALKVFDVVGAGDTVIATLSCVLALGGSLTEAAACANAAAGIVVAKPDTATVAPEELLDHFDRLTTGRRHEGAPILLSSSDVSGYAAARRSEGKRVGFTNGVFDIVHPGHVSLLRFARAVCDVLIVGINSDSSVRRLGKGPERPINGEMDRASVLGAFGMVDAMILFDEDTPLELIKTIRPDVLIKGADYTVETVVGSKIVQSYGGQIILVPIVAGKSTTTIIEKAFRSKQ